MVSKTRTAALTAVLLYAAGSFTPPIHGAAAKLKPAARVVATLELGPVTVGPAETTAWTPLGSWTQAAGELNLLYGRTTATGPASCHNSSGQDLGGFLIEGSGRFNEGGPPAPDEREFALVLVGPFGNLAQTITRNFSRALSNQVNPLFAPETATTHSIDVQLHNDCAEAGETVSISVEVVVVAIP